jgi:uncharacterized repeat protein (TIGR01451 family)
MIAVRRMVLSLVPALLLVPVAMAQDGNNLVLDSLVELAKSETAADGSVTTRYTKPDVVVPGDRVRITLRFHNRSREAIQNLKLRNPIPDGLQFDGTENLAGFTVSVDGGNAWGDLAGLSVTPAGEQARAATFADITHVMWILPEPVASGGRGSVSFFTRVR